MTMQIPAAQIATIAFAICILLTSCASYTPDPLNRWPDLKSSTHTLLVSADRFPLPYRASHTFDPHKPLDVDDIAIIAVANNPNLRAIRAKLGVAQAQVFAAGILPNPLLTFDYGFLIGGPGTTDSILAGLSQDIVPLLTRSTRRSGAASHLINVELDTAWQEWQVVSRARFLFVDAVSLGKQRKLITESLQLFKERYERSSEAMKAGNAVLTTVASDLVALNAAETQLNDIEQLLLKNKHDLNALLGLTPEVTLRLAEVARVPAIDAVALEPRLIDLAARRPDLLALRAGYQAQEEKVRQAVIEQFPKLSVGSNFARDTTDVRTQSLAVTISLPIFDRNQGNIAIEHATREQLWQEYQARLDTAYGESKRLVSELQLFEAQYQTTAQSVQRLRVAVSTAEPAFRAGNLDERTFMELQTSLLAQQIAMTKLEQSILEQRVGLQTLIGSHLPDRRLDLSRIP